MNISDRRYLVISVIGSHAGEETGSIFSRKKKEIQRNGKTYWLIKSFKARTCEVQNFCERAKKEHEDVFCLFIHAGTKSSAKPTLHDSLVQQISENGSDWASLPSDVIITGKVDQQSTALVLDQLTELTGPSTVDLWNFSESNGKPIKLQLGASTICCKNIASVGMKSRIRNIAAFGKLSPPYAVWIQ